MVNQITNMSKCFLSEIKQLAGDHKADMGEESTQE